MNREQRRAIQSSPIFKEAEKLLGGGSSQEQEQKVRKICADRGLDFDALLIEFKKEFPNAMF